MNSITAIQHRIRSGASTPERALAEARVRIDAREEAIGAFARLAADPRPGTGPLAGIALGVKDIVDTADLATEMGAPAIWGENQPRADAAIVTALTRAGATVVGKTTTTAFATTDPTPTRNPHDPARTPGGSSAGSAAAVGGGLIPLAIGTQTGGSVIRPASFCGAAAIKPSFRLLPTVGVKCLAWTLDTLGLYAQTVPDLVEALRAASGRPLAGEPGRPPRLGVSRQRFAGGADPDGEAALEEAIRRLSAAGATLVDAPEPSSHADAWAAHPTIMDYEASVALGWEYDTARDRLPPMIRATLENGRAIGAPAYDDARRLANAARRDSRSLFDGLDGVVTYSALGEAPLGLDTTGDARLNRLWTLLGTPCVNVPGLRGPSGMPIGIQVVAPFGQDARALALGAFLEPLLRD